MIPYLLAAIGGYLIGESTKSKFLDNAANGSVADAGLEVATASVLEKGGEIKKREYYRFTFTQRGNEV
jgi:hypothetical protein